MSKAYYFLREFAHIPLFGNFYSNFFCSYFINEESELNVKVTQKETISEILKSNSHFKCP